MRHEKGIQGRSLEQFCILQVTIKCLSICKLNRGEGICFCPLQCFNTHSYSLSQFLLYRISNNTAMTKQEMALVATVKNAVWICSLFLATETAQRRAYAEIFLKICKANNCGLSCDPENGLRWSNWKEREEFSWGYYCARFLTLLLLACLA